MPIDPSDVKWDDKPAIDPAAVQWDEKKPEKDNALQYLVGGSLEPLAKLASGAIATPVAGLAGVGATLTKALGLTQKDPADLIHQIESAGTYQPRTKTGKQASELLELPFQKLAQGAEWAGDKTLAATKSPTAAATVASALEALPTILGSKVKIPGGKAVRSALQDSTAAADKANAIKAPENTVREAASEAGYKMPAVEAENTLMNHIIEGSTGKVRAQQKASVANQEVTNSLVRKTIGLPDNEPITIDGLNRIRKEQGKVYDELSTYPQRFKSTQEFQNSVNDIRTQAADLAKYKTTADQSGAMLDVAEDLNKADFSPKDTVTLLKKLRSDAQANEATAKAKGGDVVLAAKARAQKMGAQAIEKMIDDNLAANGNAELMGRFRDARTRIAQTYTVEKALNPVSGNVSAQKLYQTIKAGKSLGGDMRLAGEFAGISRLSAQMPEGISGSPTYGPMDFAAATLGGPSTIAKMAAKPLLKMGSTRTPKPVTQAPPNIQVILDQLLNNQMGISPITGAPVGQEQEQR